MIEDVEFGAAGEVGASLDSQSGGLVERENEIVTLIEVADGPAVGDDVTIKTPFVAEKIEEKLIGTGGLAADGVVGAHDGVGVALRNRSAEGGSVGVVEIVERDGNIEAMAKGLRAAVNGIVFRSGNGLEVMEILALKAGDKSDAESCGEEGIFAVGFLPASPARIAKDVDVGGPEGETVVAAGVVVESSVVIFGTGFGGDDAGDTVEEIGIPGGGETDGLRENGSDAGARDAMEAFVPPVVGGDVETRDGGSDVLHLGDFFFEGEAGKEIVDALVDGERGVEVGWSGWSGLSESSEWNND